MQFFSDKNRKHCGKGENAGYQNFFPFPKMFSIMGFKCGIVRWNHKGLTHSHTMTPFDAFGKPYF